MASSTLIRAGVQPVETPEVVEAVAAALSADVAFADHLRPAGSLYVHRLPLAAAAGGGDADGSEAESGALWALLREMATVGASATPETPDGLVSVPLQLQLSLDPAGLAAPDRVLSRGHVLAWRALQDVLVTGGEGEGAFVATGCLTRDGAPSPARSDGHGRLYSSAYFTAPVRPVAPQP